MFQKSKKAPFAAQVKCQIDKSTVGLKRKSRVHSPPLIGRLFQGSDFSAAWTRWGHCHPVL